MTLPSPLRVGIVGPGRVGTALAAALGEAGAQVVGPLGRGERPTGCDAIVLCVPDAEIPAAAETVTAAAPLIGHTSGATPLAALAQIWPPAFGIHPLQSFAHPGVSFEGAGAAVAGTSPEALAFATALAERLGMTPFEIDDDGCAAIRTPWHRRRRTSSVTLQAAAEAIARGAGLGREEARALLMPLVRQTVENMAELGPEAALTGPVVRDEATVAAQRAAVEETAPEDLLDLFDELVRRTRALAGQEAPA